MKFLITNDSNEESGISNSLLAITPSTFRFFQNRNYGDGLGTICIVLMCRDPNLKFRRRIRYVKSSQALYLDIMLDLQEISHAPNSLKLQEITTKIIEELPPVLAKYAKKHNADSNRFMFDLESWFKVNHWM